MTEKKCYPLTDIGGGDGGKGTTLHKLCDLRRPHTVLKEGGSNGNHGVHTSKGQIFGFSQFGCGTFGGARTHITDRFVVYPEGILNEGNALRYEYGITDIYKMITIDENALCATPFHGLASRLRELARKDNPRGTVGTGVGEAYVDSLVHPDLAIRAKDLLDPNLRKRLETIRQQKIVDLKEVLETDFLFEDWIEARSMIDLLHSEKFVDRTVEKFREMAKRVEIVDGDYCRRKIFSRSGVIVCESSHGVLTDRYYGFCPHTSKLRTIPNLMAWDHLKDYDGEIVKLGVTRAYAIRHGAGPLVTEKYGMIGTAGILPFECEPADRYRGAARVGALDCVALRYAINVCGGPQAFDGLVVTWFDRIETLGLWQYCSKYEHADDPEFFSPEGEIVVRRGEDAVQLARQERLGQYLKQCRPKLQSYVLLDGTTRDEVVKLCADTIGGELGIPVRMISFGPTEKDKVLL